MIFMLVTFENVRFGYDEKNILEDVCFTVSEGDRIGLIGPNGEGKTTLVRLLTGGLAPDAGRVLKKSGLKVGLLEQTGGLESGKTVYEEMRGVFAPVFRAMEEQRELSARLAQVQFGGEEYKAR